jgi:organic anion transporter 4A
MSYFSPCHAGCSVEVNREADDWNNRAFTECTCVSILSGGGTQSSQVTTLSSSETPVKSFASLGSAGGGICASGNCQAGLLGFAGLFFAGSFFSFSSTVARTNVLLRSVEPKYRPMAIALKNALLVMLTTLPAPLVYGWVIDRSCILWDDECGGTTNCLEYDNWKMRISLCLLAVLPNTASVAFYFFAFKLLKDRGFVNNDENMEESLSAQGGGGGRNGRHQHEAITPVRSKRGIQQEVDQDPLLSEEGRGGRRDKL